MLHGKPQHVGNRHAGNHGPIELRLLQHRRKHQEAAIAGAVNPEPIRSRDLRLNQPLRGGVEVVKRDLPVLAARLFMPALAGFASATDVRDGIDAAKPDPGRWQSTKDRP